MRWRRLWVIFLFVLTLLGSSSSRVLVGASSATLDPYATLRVPRKASQEEIRQSYRALCLRYHPDKNVGRSERERKECEDIFKDVQKAYSLIGDTESRRNHDLMERFSRPYGSPKYNYGPSPPSFSGASQPGRFSSLDELFSEVFRQRYTFGTPSSFSNRSPADIFNLSRFKSIYVQKVEIPLEELFTGKAGCELSLKNTFWQRLTAAFRGGVGLVLLYQSFLFTLPMMRLSKLASLFIGTVLFQKNLPQPTKSNFLVHLKAGYKEGTKIIFTEEGYDAVFVLQEANHPRFVRQGDDLYTTIYVTQRQARRGAVLRTNHLDGSTLHVRVPSGSKSGHLIRLAQQGWPNRRTNSRGDLLVQIRIKSRAPW